MRKYSRILFRSLAALVILAAVSYSPAQVGACPPFGRFDTYYDYGWTLNQIGWHDRDCGCGSYSGGSFNGLWKVSDFYDCDYQEVYNTEYWGRCNPGDGWTLMSGPTDYPNWC